jgi:hypothetical protein
MSDVRLDEQALDDLRERVRETHEAAERLVREATAQAEAAGGVPPRGWEAPAPAREVTDEAQALVALLNSLRGLLPPDLREQVNDLVRQLLLIVRALIDLLVDRLEPGPRGAEPAVEDIPID